jgi:AcrR family transcriptional regulator
VREKDPNKEIAIYKATLQLVLQHGFTALKMQDVAKAANIATGTLYIYFENKVELINHLYLHLKRSNASDFFLDYDPTAPFMVCFEKIWRNYVYTQLKEPETAAFLEQYYRSPYLKETVQKETDTILQPIFDLLERGKQEKLIKDVPTALLAIQLNGAIGELVRWHNNRQIAADNEIVNQAFALAWDSIKR